MDFYVYSAIIMLIVRLVELSDAVVAAIPDSDGRRSTSMLAMLQNREQAQFLVGGDDFDLSDGASHVHN